MNRYEDLTILKKSGNFHVGYEIKDKDQVMVERGVIKGKFEEDCRFDRVYLSYEWVEKIYNEMKELRKQEILESFIEYFKLHASEHFVSANFSKYNDQIINVVIKDFDNYLNIIHLYFEWLDLNEKDFGYIDIDMSVQHF